VVSAEQPYAEGNDANARGDFAAAVPRYRKALELAPRWPEAQHNLATALHQLGHNDEAFDLFRAAANGSNGAFSCGMMAVIIPGCPGATNQSILESRQEWSRLITPEPSRISTRANRASRGPLRLGYMCSFFDRENYMKPVWPLINRHDRRQFEVHLLSDTARDTLGSAYKSHPSDAFHYTGGLKIEACAASIELAQLDILVDLNAYSRWRRLPVYALRPAPVIASWFNSYATTGMSSVDYLIGDQVVVTSDEERYYSEKIVRVPGSYLTFEVSYPVPDVAAPPCLTTRRVTFGCLAPLYKITPPVIAAWSRILRESTGSSLLLKNAALASAANREFLLHSFAEQGIARSRILLEAPEVHCRFLDAYGRIDIALDTFPYGGGTTTTEALWQGVPVLTFYGDRWASRTSASLLRAGNLGQFVAEDLETYVRMAIDLVNDPATPAMLSEVRHNMRDWLRESSVCDTNRFAREMEGLYLQMHAETMESVSP
jgi:protein O-GlcNAc transferase